MNIFRFIADMLHLAAILTLLYRIKVSRNVVGKSPPSSQSPFWSKVTFSLSGNDQNTCYWYNFDPFRSIVQDSRDLSNRVLPAIHGPLHVLREPVQYMHEDLLHYEHNVHNLPNASSQAIQDDLRLPRRLIPSLDGSPTGSLRADLYRLNWMEPLGIHMELLLMARGTRVHSIDRDAAQDQSN
jgi:hypothetical protein